MFSFYEINKLTSERINLLLFVICAGKCISETLNITRAEIRLGETGNETICLFDYAWLKWWDNALTQYYTADALCRLYVTVCGS